MSLIELYYEHYRENACKNYWDLDIKILPYGLKFKSVEAQQAYIKKLEQAGYRSVGTGKCYHLFINIITKRFASPFYACKYALENDRLYSPEEFDKILIEHGQMPIDHN